MKIIDENGNERNETRPEILSRHERMRQNHAAAMDFLNSIHEETGLNKISLDAVAEEHKEQAERQQDEGLTTEINTSTSLVSVRDTLDNCEAIIKGGLKGEAQKDGLYWEMVEAGLIGKDSEKD